MLCKDKLDLRFLINIFMVILFFFIMIFLITFIHAQELEEVEKEKGLKIAKFLFYPSILFGYEYNDNVFSRNDLFEKFFGLDLISDNIYLVKPTFKFVIPFSQSYALISYSPQYREFKEYDLDEKISHIMHFNTIVKFSNGMKIIAKEEYTQGILEVETFDPGGEVVFGADTYTYNSSFIGFGHELPGMKGFEIKASYDDLSFNHKERSSFFDYKIKGMKASYYQALSSSFSIITDYTFRHAHQFIPIFKFGNEMIGSKEDEYDEQIITLGAKGNLFKKTTGSISISYSKLNFKTEMNSDFSGITGEAQLNTKLTNVFSINLSLKKYAYQSYFLNNKYYVSTLALAGFRYYIKNNIILNFKGSYYLNEYNKVINVDPDFIIGIYNGLKREDKTSRIDTGINYLFNDLSAIRFGFSYINRESNVDLYDYEVNRFFMQIGFGWF